MTSSLSATRSNQLSYEPEYGWSEGPTKKPPAGAGGLQSGETGRCQLSYEPDPDITFRLFLQQVRPLLAGLGVKAVPFLRIALASG